MATFTSVPLPVCSQCGDPVDRVGLCSRCRVSPPHIDGIRSLFIFSGVLREVVHQFKYNGIKVLAAPLGQAMVELCAAVGGSVDIVVPVPLHRARIRERGYNQSSLLAGVVAGQLGLDLNERDLCRRRSTRPQVGLDIVGRRANVTDAFACNSEAFSGRQVLLIDDVCTTGATLEACAAALYGGGVRAVFAVTLARAHWQSVR